MVWDECSQCKGLRKAKGTVYNSISRKHSHIVTAPFNKESVKKKRQRDREVCRQFCKLNDRQAERRKRKRTHPQSHRNSRKIDERK